MESKQKLEETLETIIFATNTFSKIRYIYTCNQSMSFQQALVPSYENLKRINFIYNVPHSMYIESFIQSTSHTMRVNCSNTFYSYAHESKSRVKDTFYKYNVEEKEHQVLFLSVFK